MSLSIENERGFAFTQDDDRQLLRIAGIMIPREQQGICPLSQIDQPVILVRILIIYNELIPCVRLSQSQARSAAVFDFYDTEISGIVLAVLIVVESYGIRFGKTLNRQSLGIDLLVRSPLVFPIKGIDISRISNDFPLSVQRVNVVLRDCRQRTAQKQRRKNQVFHIHFYNYL